MSTKGIEALKLYRERVVSGEIVPKQRKKQPSRIKAIKEKCKDCCCDYADGRVDCEVPTCSLYYWMPYRDRKFGQDMKAALKVGF